MVVTHMVFAPDLPFIHQVIYIRQGFPFPTRGCEPVVTTSQVYDQPALDPCFLKDLTGYGRLATGMA